MIGTLSKYSCLVGNSSLLENIQENIFMISLKELLQMCMESTAQGAYTEINTPQGEAECCIYLETCF